MLQFNAGGFLLALGLNFGAFSTLFFRIYLALQKVFGRIYRAERGWIPPEEYFVIQLDRWVLDDNFRTWFLNSYYFLLYSECSLTLFISLLEYKDDYFQGFNPLLETIVLTGNRPLFLDMIIPFFVLKPRASRLLKSRRRSNG